MWNSFRSSEAVKSIRQQVHDAILALRREFTSLHNLTVWSINNGWCDEFAESLQEGFPKGKVFWGEEVYQRFKTNVNPAGHAFFFIRGLYFDAECPNGVTSPAMNEVFTLSVPTFPSQPAQVAGEFDLRA